MSDTKFTPEMSASLDRTEANLQDMRGSVARIEALVGRIGMLAADLADKAGDPETAERVRAVVQS